MTLRAILLGLLGATVIVAAGGLYNDQFVHLSKLIGNQMPVCVFGLLLLGSLSVNPLLWRLRPAWVFRPSEIAIIAGMMLFACCIPNGWARCYSTSMALPVRSGNTELAWKKYHLVQQTPPALLPAGGRDDPAVVEAYWSGARHDGSHVGFTEVPWAAWAGPARTWLPMALLLGACCTALALIVHRQWAYRERLRYPLVEVAQQFIASGPSPWPSILRNRLFWIGAGVAFTIHLFNGMYTWTGGRSLAIPMDLNLLALANKFPRIWSQDGFFFMTPKFFPCVIGLAYLVAADVSLSIGLSQLFYIIAFLTLTSWGIEPSRDSAMGGIPDAQRFGSYLGLTLLLLYIGRRYYWGVLRAALWSAQAPSDERSAVWACRVFLLATGALIWILVSVGLSWPLAVGLVLLSLMTFVVIGRLTVESGLFYIQPYWQPAAVLLGIFGASAIGPQAGIILGLFVVTFVHFPAEAMVPYALHALKLGQDAGVSPGRSASVGSVAFAAALVVTVGVMIWHAYDRGLPVDNFARDQARIPYDFASRITAALPDFERGPSQTMSGAQRLGVAWSNWTSWQVDRKFVWPALAGLVLVLGVSTARMRLPWWPLHPMLFLVWGTYPAQMFAPSFLAGWLLRSLVVRLGGSRIYRTAAPFMMGLIAGDLLASMFWMLQGGLFYALSGTTPGDRAYRVLP